MSITRQCRRKPPEIDPRALARFARQRRKRLVIAAQLLAGLLANPSVVNLDCNLFRERGVHGKDHRAGLVALSWSLAGELMDLKGG